MNPPIIAGLVHPIDDPKFKDNNIAQSVTTNAIIPGMSIVTFPSRFWFGMFNPINTIPRIRGKAGISIATVSIFISVSIPAIILPPKPPTAIAAANIPIAFGTSFLSFINPIII